MPDLDQPLDEHLMRTLVAFGELVLVVVLGGLTWWCWQRGIIMTIQDGVELTRIDGRWWAIAIATATLAGILLLDALRRVVLTAPTRPQRGSDGWSLE